MSTTTYKKPEPSPAEAEELYKTGARGVQEVQQRVQQEDGAEEEQQGKKEEGEGGRKEEGGGADGSQCEVPHPRDPIQVGVSQTQAETGVSCMHLL